MTTKIGLVENELGIKKTKKLLQKYVFVSYEIKSVT